MTEPTPITATYAIATWLPSAGAGLLSGIDGIGSAYIRKSYMLRVVFVDDAAKAAFPARLRRAIAAAGGELLVCEEIQARYR